MTRLISNINDNRARYVAPVEISSSLTVTGSITLTDSFLKFKPTNVNINTNESASYIYVSGSTQDLYFSQNGSGFNNVTRLRWLEGNLYTGLLHGGLITSQSSTMYQISSGSGIIVKLNASIGNDPYPIVQYLEWNNLSASIASLSASFDQSFVAITASGASAVIAAKGTPYENGEYNTNIPIGVVLHQNHSSINGVQTFPGVAYGWKQRSFDFIRAFGPLKVSGYTLAKSGSSTGSLVLSGGAAFVDGRNYTIDPNIPSYIVEAAGITTSKIFRYYESGSNWVYNTNNGAGFGAIDPTQYSNGGVLTAVPGTGANRKWTIQRVYYFPNSATKAFYVYYGNALYDNQTAAIAGMLTETFNEAPNTKANALYVGSIVVRNDANFTDATSYAIEPAGLFRASGVGGGGGSAGGATTPGGSPTQIQYNNVGTFGGVQTLVYDGTTLHATGSFSGSLVGTATSASYASTASYINALQQDVQITGSLSTKGTFSVGRITTSNAVIQRAQSPAGSYSFIFAGGSGLVDTYPYTMADTHAATMELRAGDPTSDQYGGGIIFSANGHTSPLGEGNAVIFKTRSGVNTYTERMRITQNGAQITGSVNATSFTGSLQGTSSYASTAKTISSQYLCQGILEADQTINNSSDTIIQYVNQYDPYGWYDTGTYRFTPTVAGYYSISAGAWLESTVDTNNQMNLQGRKNGSTFAIVQSPTNGVTGQSLGFTKIVYFNGSGDYMDLTIYQNSGASKSLLAGTADGSGTWFSAHLIST